MACGEAVGIWSEVGVEANTLVRCERVRASAREASERIPNRDVGLAVNTLVASWVLVRCLWPSWLLVAIDHGLAWPPHGFLLLPYPISGNLPVPSPSGTFGSRLPAT